MLETKIPHECSEASLPTPACDKKRAAFMGKAPVQGEWVWLLLRGFQHSIFKGPGGGGWVAGPVISCAQLFGSLMVKLSGGVTGLMLILRLH